MVQPTGPLRCLKPMPRARTAKPAAARAASPRNGTRIAIRPAAAGPAARRSQAYADPGATKLVGRRLEKVWGRNDLPDAFGNGRGGKPVGEIWFEHPDGADAPLLIKYLFTSEKLSVQVHPNDRLARKAGHKSGKDEAWVVLDAEPDAEIGLGLRARVSKRELRDAALDGSIEGLVDWRPAAPAEVYYSPAGTVHALGPGLMLIEIQQNVDVTYRLYDYGRPRELHLDEAVEAADPVPFQTLVEPFVLGAGREILVHGQAFVLERWSRAVSGCLAGSAADPLWVVPVRGSGTIGGEPLEPATAWMVDGNVELRLSEGSEMLIAYCGRFVRPRLLR